MKLVGPAPIVFLKAIVLAMASLTQAEPWGTFSDWTPCARQHITRIIEEGAGKGHLAFFDFDNTILCRDIGDATLAILARDGLITGQNIRAIGSPLFLHDGMVARPEEGVLQYSDHLLHATSGDGSSCSPTGYAWQVQLLSGLSVADIVAATGKAYSEGRGAADAGTLSITTVPAQDTDQPPPPPPPPGAPCEGPGGVAAPFFHRGMVELLAALLDSGYDVRIVSASNVWSVRGCARRAGERRVAQRERAGRPARPRGREAAVPRARPRRRRRR